VAEGEVEPGAANRARIAVLEDDDALRNDILLPGLAARGFEAEGFARPGELYRRMLVAPFDAVLLDVGLPGEDGLSVARHLRTISSIGIAVLSGRGDPQERIRGLREAVDVWLSKPVDVAIVAASLASLVRRVRMAAPAPSGGISAGWRLEAGGWRLHAPSGRAVELSRSERCVLQQLFAAGGEPVSRDALIVELGESLTTFDAHRLEMLVHRMRRKVAGETGAELPLRAVRNLGYVLLARAGES
jgi:two-component system, OmpR family, response regulator PhoP